MYSKLVHPKRISNLYRVFNSIGTVAHRSVTLDTFGGELITYTPDPALQGLRLYKEPATGTEVRQPLQTVTLNMFTLALDGFYPTIRQDDQITINSNLTYNILRVAHDDAHTSTILTVEIVNEDENNSID